VGPIYRDGRQGEADLLASAYRESLKLASAKGIKSLAFPSLSTGVYGYPIGDAAKVALATVKDYLNEHPEIEIVRFVLFGKPTYEAYAKALAEI
jgi:O-acetyl-ADP-ribose deacetylase (regulator of RNase III)